MLLVTHQAKANDWLLHLLSFDGHMAPEILSEGYKKVGLACMPVISAPGRQRQDELRPARLTQGVPGLPGPAHTGIP